MTPEETFPLLDVHGRLLLDAAEAAGWATAAPTCPGWTVRDLLRHQGLVHRWATANLQAAGECVEDTAFEATVDYPADEALPGWYADGLDALLETLADTSDDQAVWTFFPGESPRRFWLRRQLHETAVHRMDAELAAGRPLTVVPQAMAVDGIDELLVGFLQRPTARLRSAVPWTVAAVVTGGEATWTVHVSSEVPVTVRELGPADAVLTGSADALYAYLWNRRRDGVDVTGESAVADRWRDGVRIQW